MPARVSICKMEKDYHQAFNETLEYMSENNYSLAGAVFDFHCSEEKGQLYLFFPIHRL